MIEGKGGGCGKEQGRESDGESAEVREGDREGKEGKGIGGKAREKGREAKGRKGENEGGSPSFNHPAILARSISPSD